MQNGVTKIAGMDDEAAYHQLKHSLLSLEFSAKERAYMLRMISLVLNLGNLTFKTVENKVSVQPQHFVEACATMLRCDVPLLTEALTEPFTDGLAASRSRDLFARCLYSRLTNWVIKRLNEVTATTSVWLLNLVISVCGCGGDDTRTRCRECAACG